MFDFLKSSKAENIGIKEDSVKIGKARVYISKLSSSPIKARGRVSKDSKQISGKERRISGLDGLVEHPYNFGIFQELYESCEPFFSTVNQIATDVAGLGFKLLLKEGEEEDEKEKKRITDFLNHPNGKQTLRDLSNTLIQDWGVLGYGMLEVVRNAGGEVAEIYPLRSSTIWIHESKERYCQQVLQKKVWFKEYGVEEDIDIKTGKARAGLAEEDKANEVILFFTQYGKNNFYPIPNILPALMSAFSLRGIRGFNLSFFENYSIPAMAIMLHGRWEEGTSDAILSFLDEKIKSSDNAHKTIVLEVPEGGKVEFEKLMETEIEGAFKNYVQSLEDAILMVYSMPAYRIGRNIVGRLGGSNIQESTEIYKQSVVEPLQEKLENIINFQILEIGMNISKYKFKLNPLDTRDLQKETEMYNTEIEHGIRTPNEVRNLKGLEPYAEGDKFYIGAGLQEAGELEIKKRDEDEMRLITEFTKLRSQLKEEADD